MEDIHEKKGEISNNDLGLILWKLESIEKFFPSYKTIIKK